MTVILAFPTDGRVSQAALAAWADELEADFAREAARVAREHGHLLALLRQAAYLGLPAGFDVFERSQRLRDAPNEWWLAHCLYLADLQASSE
jgi:hypothetical protein